MAHGTRHSSRLNRGKADGRTGYALEELVAEFTASFVSKEIGLATDAEEYERHLKNHAAYIT